jgi:hypothetical protein
MVIAMMLMVMVMVMPHLARVAHIRVCISKLLSTAQQIG